MEEQLSRFASVLQEQQIARHVRDYPFLDALKQCAVEVHYGKKWIRVDVGDSGKYMVLPETGEIFGIKAYGVPHPKHKYGTLDTIDSWDWSGYVAVPRR